MRLECFNHYTTETTHKGQSNLIFGCMALLFPYCTHVITVEQNGDLLNNLNILFQPWCDVLSLYVHSDLHQRSPSSIHIFHPHTPQTHILVYFVKSHRVRQANVCVCAVSQVQSVQT